MPEDQTAELGEQIRRYRRRAGLSQVQLATRAGLATAAISALERGARARPYPTTLRLLAEALGLTPEEQAGLAVAATGQAPARQAATPTLAVHLIAPPIPPTPLLGRPDDVESLVALLRAPAPRLITLTGVGGGGKSRLAIAVADEVHDAFPDGVCWVDLNRISFEATLRGIGAQLSADQLAAAMAEGRMMGIDEVLDAVRQSLPCSPDPTRSGGRSEQRGRDGALGMTG